MMRLLCLATLLCLPALQAAQAHAILLESQPALGAVVGSGPIAITMRFNSRIDRARSRLVLRMGAAETALPLAPDSPADRLTSSTTLQPGDYVLRWQVLAVDGHITRGDVPFHVQEGAAGRDRVAGAPAR